MGYKYGAKMPIFAGKSQALPSGSPSDHNERTKAFLAPRFLAMICLSLLSRAAAFMRPFSNKTNLTFSKSPPPLSKILVAHLDVYRVIASIVITT